MTKDVLVLGVLDKLAKEQLESKDWKEHHYCNGAITEDSDFWDEVVERSVVLGVLAGRKAEKERIVKEIDKMISDYESGKVIYEVDSILLTELKKRFVGGKKE